jgi:hypothetical protein
VRALAAVGSDLAARPVLAAAQALAGSLGLDVTAVHVAGDDGQVARAAADAAGVELVEVDPPVLPALLQAAAPDDVAGVVVGARRLPAGARGVGGTAGALIARLRKPVVIVPPDAVAAARLERIVIPLSGIEAVPDDLLDDLATLAAAGVELVLLHVPFGDAIPPFDDQPQHETVGWAAELVRRTCDVPGAAVRLELRDGLPGEQVLRVAAEEDADLIGLAWSQSSSPGRAHVVRQVLTGAHVPVALYPIL